MQAVLYALVFLALSAQGRSSESSLGKLLKRIPLEDSSDVDELNEDQLLLIMNKIFKEGTDSEDSSESATGSYDDPYNNGNYMLEEEVGDLFDSYSDEEEVAVGGGRYYDARGEQDSREEDDYDAPRGRGKSDKEQPVASTCYQPCMLPFKFKGKTYHGCTKDGDKSGYAWCKTSNAKWDYCDCVD